MKISTSLNHGLGMGCADAYESACLMKQAGFDAIDLSMCEHETEPEIIRTAAWQDAIVAQANAAKRAGLEIAQCHLPSYPGHVPPVGDGSWQDFADFMLPSYVRALETCALVGCPVAVMHPFFNRDSASVTHEGNVRIIEKLLPLMEKAHVRLALENVYGYERQNYLDTFVARAEDIKPILDELDHPLVGACIDTGHANIFRLNIADMARMYGKKLYALHVNGNAGKDEHIIPYTSSGWCEQMDYHAFSAALKEIGYSGSYNLEVASGKMPLSVAGPFYGYAAAVARALANEAE